MIQDDHDNDMGITSKESSPLGLKLPRTPSFLSMLGKMSEEKKQGHEPEGSSSNHAKGKTKTEEEKLKASNFPATYIKIGAWQKMTRQAGDLVVKLYYAKRKLVWEILEGPLKNKMEIQWSDICAIRAKTTENEPGILEIELNQPPVYYRETCPQPRKHTLWEKSTDFTGGQAPIWRRHLVAFPPGILGKNYEKLLQCDAEINAISKKPFPRHESLYFEPCIFETTLDFSRHGANKVAGYSYKAYPTIIPREPLFRATPDPSLSVLDLPITYQGGENYNFVVQNQASWQQSTSIDNFDMHATFGIYSATRNANNVYDPPFLSTTNANNVYDPMFTYTTNMSNAYDHVFPSITNGNNVYDPLYYDFNASGLLSGIQNDFDKLHRDNTLLQTISSINSLLEPVGVNNSNESSYKPVMAFNVVSGDLGNQYDLDVMIPDSINWLVAEGSSENIFPDSNENVFHSSCEDLLQGSVKDVFQGLGKDIFQDSCEDVFEGSQNDAFHNSSENMLQGTNDTMFQGENDNMLKYTGNNSINVGVGGFYNLFPF